MIKVNYKDLGNIEYSEAWAYQEKIFDTLVKQKQSNRSEGLSDKTITENYLFTCSHPHVYTLGKSGSKAHLLINDTFLNNIGAQYFQTNRGGDITYHGPEQIVGYPILNLDNFFTDIHQYLRFLEEVIIQTLAHYSIEAHRYKGYTGVWLEPDNPHRARKICAMGVRCSRWVTMHGWALNVNTNLDYFNYIVPCGIENKKVTSLHLELNKSNVDKQEVTEVLLNKFSEIFKVHFSKLDTLVHGNY
jgi:lipoyl(octanoyl) transferase